MIKKILMCVMMMCFVVMGERNEFLLKDYGEGMKLFGCKPGNTLFIEVDNFRFVYKNTLCSQTIIFVVNKLHEYGIFYTNNVFFYTKG